MPYKGFERRQENSWKLTKTIDVGTIVAAVILLIALMGLSNKLENRITTVETKIEMILQTK